MLRNLNIAGCNASCQPPATRWDFWCGSERSKGCQDGAGSEADDAAEWAQVMVSRYDLGDVDLLTAEAEAATVVERVEFQAIFEKLAYLGAMIDRGRHNGECGRPTAAGSQPSMRGASHYRPSNGT